MSTTTAQGYIHLPDSHRRSKIPKTKHTQQSDRDKAREKAVKAQQKQKAYYDARRATRTNKYQGPQGPINSSLGISITITPARSEKTTPAQHNQSAQLDRTPSRRGHNTGVYFTQTTKRSMRPRIQRITYFKSPPEKITSNILAFIESGPYNPQFHHRSHPINITYLYFLILTSSKPLISLVQTNDSVCPGEVFHLYFLPIKLLRQLFSNHHGWPQLGL